MTLHRLSSHISSPLKRQRSLTQLCFWVSGSIGVIGAFIGFAGAVLQNPILVALGAVLFVASVLFGVIADWASRELLRRLAIAEPDNNALERQLHQTWQSGYETGKLEAFAVIEPDPEAGLPPGQYRLTPEVDALEEQLEMLQLQMQQAAEQYSREVEARDSLIAELHSRLAQQANEQEHESNPFNNPAQQEANWLKQRLAERDRQIQTLRSQLEQLTQAHREALKDQHSQGYAEGVSQARTQYLLQIEKLATTNIQLQEQLQQQSPPKSSPLAQSKSPQQTRQKFQPPRQPSSPVQPPPSTSAPKTLSASSPPAPATSAARSPQTTAPSSEQQLSLSDVLPQTPSKSASTESSQAQPTPPESAAAMPEAPDSEIAECPHCHTKTRHAIQGRNKKTGKINRWKCKNKDCRKTFKAIN
ncbi:MAG: hypothetical protein F6J87_08885 [Spirulina sp. SIO3F2]|nr:hypothetical protein [Spirulina sp. SIO3F2]